VRNAVHYLSSYGSASMRTLIRCLRLIIKVYCFDNNTETVKRQEPSMRKRILLLNACKAHATNHHDYSV